MALTLDSFKDASKRPGSKCAVSSVRDALTAKDRAAVDDALADASISAAAISRVLVDAGHRISSNSVAHHRRGDCRCGKDDT